ILALHRIQSARATTLSFERPKEFDLESYDGEGKFGFGEGKRIRLSFRITKEAGLHLLESPLSEDQTVKELEDEYEITATVIEIAWAFVDPTTGEIPFGKPFRQAARAEHRDRNDHTREIDDLLRYAISFGSGDYADRGLRLKASPRARLRSGR